MRRMFPVLLCCLASFSFAGCNKADSDATKKAGNDNAKPAAQGADVKRDGYVGVIQGATLDKLQKNTIGGAFAGYRYFATRDWNESKTKDGKIVVDFYGQLDKVTFTDRDRSAGLIGRALDIKFVINDQGAFWIDSISRYDNKPGGMESYAVADFGSVLPKIYANEVIRF
ncbi:MAG TPA: hypothetical protein VI298_09490 [Geobacteraceae bacterium]